MPCSRPETAIGGWQIEAWVMCDQLRKHNMLPTQPAPMLVWCISSGNLSEMPKMRLNLCRCFFHFVVQSFTTTLTSIVDTSSKNLFSKALMIDGCLEQSFRSCLGAIRSSIKLVNSCGTTGSLQQWNAAGTVYTSFVVSVVLCNHLSYCVHDSTLTWSLNSSSLVVK